MLQLTHLYKRSLTALALFVALASSVGPPVWAQSQSQPEQSDSDAIVNQLPLTNRVIGGDSAGIGVYPSIVALVSPGNRPIADRLFCGGTVVAPRWVMTAAHCLHDGRDEPTEPALVQVVAGINDLDDESAVPVQAVQVIIHPDFDLSLSLPPDDIALVELEEDLSVEPAVLFAGDNTEYLGTLASIAGWGAIEYDSPFDATYPTLLQDAEVPIVSNETCNEPDSYDGIIANSHLCAGFEEGGVDACAGDSGGPLYLTIEGVQTQAGITSFGIGCGLPDFYGIYTSISHQIAWLSQYIETPYQSPDLVAARLEEEAVDSSGNNSDDDSDSSFLGATFAPTLWVLLGFCAARGFRNFRLQLNSATT